MCRIGVSSEGEYDWTNRTLLYAGSAAVAVGVAAGRPSQCRRVQTMTRDPFQAVPVNPLPGPGMDLEYPPTNQPGPFCRAGRSCFGSMAGRTSLSSAHRS